MCGITAIISKNDNITPILINSLEKLEYRGYDSCGIFVHDQNSFQVKKNVGEVKAVSQQENFHSLSGYLGVAHTRWATHGGVSCENSHPMTSSNKEFVVVHNGIISNFRDLKELLIKNGFSFISETDTEVFVLLLELNHRKFKDIETLFVETIKMIEGHYSIVMFSIHEPHKLYAVKNDTPLLLGVGNNMNFLSSDANAFLEWTREAIEIKDEEYLIVSFDQYQIKSVADQQPIEREAYRIDWNSEEAQKGGFEHYMLKEIFELPSTISKSMKIDSIDLERAAQSIFDAKRTYFLGVGTTYYVALYGSYLFSSIAGLQVSAFSTDESPNYLILDPGDLTLFISQSGETYDTRIAIKKSLKVGCKTISILNVIGSSMSQMVDQCIYQGSGPEISVVSTKAAVSQMIILHRLALKVAVLNGRLNKKQVLDIENELISFSLSIGDLLNEQSGHIHNMAIKYLKNPDTAVSGWLYLGKNIFYPVALESALKMKEVTYLHAEGMPAGFLKHGTLAMVDQQTASFFFLPSSSDSDLYASSVHALQEVKARQGKTLGFASVKDTQILKLFDDFFPLPDMPSYLTPYFEIIVAQLFAYYAALVLDRNVDKPRNLAKSVTVG